MEVDRSIVFYEKQGERLIGEIPIYIEIGELKNIFIAKKDDPLLYDPYKIGKKEKEALIKLISVNIDLDSYDYFLECFQKK